ncbi:YhcB family protein [Aliagarivorans taiwanensis]|uniref:YhcB family protein n=1 Tax=Aliagarivorans taiwanensis TaxID=561966 RepID=UPI00047BAB8E|nr:YhcB family protein [Aliagarivorans taiwanensis]
MDPTSSVIFLLIGVAIGYFVSRLFGKSSVSERSITQELDQNRKELDSYKQQVQEHFATSAQLLEDMAKQYQSIYEHMANQSKSLIGDDEAQHPLFVEYQQKLELEDTEEEESGDAQPKDYANQPSGLFKEGQRQAS